MIRLARRCFNWKQHSDGGAPGWLEEEAPRTFEPAWSGLTVAHDIMEHDLVPDGSVAEEAIAFGRMWFIRHENDYYREELGYGLGISEIERIVGNITEIHEKAQTHDQVNELLDLPALSARPLLHESVKRIKKRVRGDLLEWHNVKRDDPVIQTLDTWVPRMLQHFTVGYRKARRRFNDNQAEACHMFIQLEKAVQESLRIVRGDVWASESRLEIRTNFSRFMCEVRLFTPEDFEGRILL